MRLKLINLVMIKTNKERAFPLQCNLRFARFNNVIKRNLNDDDDDDYEILLGRVQGHHPQLTENTFQTRTYHILVGAHQEEPVSLILNLGVNPFSASRKL